MKVGNGRTTVTPGKGSGSGNGGDGGGVLMFTKKLAGAVLKPRGVGTDGELELCRTSMATSVEALNTPLGKVICALLPKTLSVMVPPVGPAVPSGNPETTMLSAAMRKLLFQVV